MPGRILILDDDVTRRITLAARLSGAFYEIRSAASPAEVLEQVADWRPGVLLVADELCEKPGAALLRALRASPQLAEVTLMVVTAPGAHIGRAELLSAGADDVIARSEPQEVFRARLRSHDRAREVLDTLKLRGNDLGLPPGLSEEAHPFHGATWISLIAPDAATRDAWQAALDGLPGFRMEFLDQAGLALLEQGGEACALPARNGVLMLGIDARQEERGLRLLAELTNRNDQAEQEILLFAPGAGPQVQAQGYELGASAVMCGPFDAAEIAARLRLLQRRLRHRRGLRQTLAETLRASVTDPLTGLHNRRYALPRLAQISRAAAMRGGSFAVLVADLDHFKAVNDAHGHAVGDLALCAVAEVMQRNLRPEDVLARIGGEEFLAILPETGQEEAMAMAQQIRDAVRRTPVAPRDGRTPIALTISVGLTLGGAGRRGPEALLADADRALYAAKNAGRDRVERHDPPEPPATAGRRMGAGR